MSQHDYAIADQPGATFLTDLNNALAAIVTNNSGATAPEATFAHQVWADTTNNKLKIRNAANDAWIEIGALNMPGLNLLPKTGGTMTGALTLPGAPTSGLHAATKTYVDTADAGKVSKTGDTMTGALTLPGAPTSGLHAATKTYVDTADALRVAKTGDTMTGPLTLSGAPSSGLHAATKTYVDGAKSLATNGYQVLPSGLILQWGQHTMTDYPRLTGPSDGQSSVTFPMAFTTVAHVMVEKNTTTPSRLPVNVWAERGSSLTGFKVRIAPEDSGDSATMVVSWMAIGC